MAALTSSVKVRLEEELRDQVARDAERQQRTLSWIIRTIVADHYKAQASGAKP